MGDLSVSKKKKFCVFVYKMSDSFALFIANTWRKNRLEAIKYMGRIWVNQGHLQEELDITNMSDRIQYYSDEF